MHPEAKHLIDYALPTLNRAQTEVTRITLLDTVFNEYDYQVDCHSHEDEMQSFNNSSFNNNSLTP